jgi:hypothetical protein
MKLILVGMGITLSFFVTGCSKESPTAPSPSSAPPPPPPTATRVVRLGGDLNFGNLSLANSPVKESVLTVSNDGNDTLQVGGISGPCAGTYLTVPGVTSFAVAPGATVSVTFRFAPRIRIDCSGTITVLGNQTSGSNTITVTARGVLPGCDVPDPLPPPCVPPSQSSSLRIVPPGVV